MVFHGSWGHAMTSNDLKNQVMIDLGPEGTWLTPSQSLGQTDSYWLRNQVPNKKNTWFGHVFWCFYFKKSVLNEFLTKVGQTFSEKSTTLNSVRFKRKYCKKIKIGGAMIVQSQP